MSAKVKTILALAALVLLLVIPLRLILLDFVRDTLAVPLSAIFQVGQALIRAIPQLPLWAFLIVLALLIAMNSLSQKRKAVQGQGRVKAFLPGPVQVLVQWLRHRGRGYYFKRRLAHRLGRLAAEMLVPHEQLASRQARQLLEQLDAPPEVRAYLLAGLGPEFAESPRPPSLLVRLRELLRASTRRTPLDLDPEVVVHFLERQA